jgi:glycine cleavage system H protein
MIPAELRYTKDHEWARLEADGTVTIGITHHAQDALGDIVYAEPPKVGATLTAGGRFGVVESVKSVSDLFAPCGGTVVAVNTDLQPGPKQRAEIINQDPYGAGWICRVQPSDPDEVAGLLSADAYAALLAAEAH